MVVCANLRGKNAQRQYLVGSFSGALSFGTRNYAELTRKNFAEEKHMLGVSKPWRLQRFVISKQINKGDRNAKAL